MKKNGFLKGKGFYIVLGLCAFAVGISSYLVFFSTEDEEILDYEVYEPIINTDTDIAVISPQENIQMDESKTNEEEEPTVEEEPTIVESKASESVKSTSGEIETVSQLFLRPVTGEVTKAFTDTELVFDKTMGDYRVHLGTDFSARTGDRVYAITSGTVKSITDDSLYGVVMVIDHGNNLEISYMGLEDELNFSEGQKVSAGDVIGTCMGVIEAESLDETHIHIEARQDGIEFDVETIIPEN